MSHSWGFFVCGMMGRFASKKQTELFYETEAKKDQENTKMV